MTAHWAYTVLRSPVGNLLAAATTEGLASLAFLPPHAHAKVQTPRAVLAAASAELTEQLGCPPRDMRSALSAVAKQVNEWFTGKRTAFTLPLDWSLSPEGFARRVLEVTTTIGWGETLSYGEVATEAGSPGAARAVGNAMAKNRIALVVPCHRVVASGGKLGGYMGGSSDGLALKRALLAREGIHPS